MDETEKKTTEEKPAKEKKAPEKVTKQIPNTMKIQLVNSAGTEINITGTAGDREIKAICKALGHTEDQKFEVKKRG